MGKNTAEETSRKSVQQWNLLFWASAPVLYLFGVLGTIILIMFWLASQLKLAIIRVGMYLTTGGNFEILPGVDAFLLYGGFTSTDPICNATLHGMVRLKGKPNLQKLQQLIKERWVESREGRNGPKKYPQLTQKVARKFGYYVWEEVNHVSMDDKIKMSSEGYTDHASLVGLVQKMQIVPLSKESPLWEIVVFPKIVDDCNDEYAILIRIHHCMCDGFRLTQMLAELLDTTPNAEKKHSMAMLLEKSTMVQRHPILQFLSNPTKRIDLRTAMQILLNALMIILSLPWYNIRTMNFKYEINALHLQKKVLSGRKLISISRQLELQHFRDVAKVHGCSINDLYLHLIARLFVQCNASVPITTDPTVRVALPVLLFPSSSWSKNGFTIVLIDLPVQDTNSENSIKSISNICQDVKSSTETFCNFANMQLMGNHYPLTLARFVSHHLINFTLTATNVCGPSTGTSIIGDPTIDFTFVPVSTGSSGVAVGLISADGKVRVGISVDETVAPNDQIAWQLAEAFETELKQIHAESKKD